ncbi:MAG TPA: hypothetical protein DHW71_04610 [Gammaproteobacteria bacterium]|nr:hypothetical protein [Gammaproteobacteria bacterium]HBF09852.1 hypothetical protein [Gammaproteobacteria bacterium]HCK92243.1 hypothetical protein [Gammaproteobacteria bacterium]
MNNIICSKLPDSWERAKLGKFVLQEKGKKPKNQNPTRNTTFSIPYIDIAAFEQNEIKSWTNGEGCKICKESDILMVWDGSRSGLIGKGINGALGSTLVRINFPQMYNQYAYYFLLSKYQEINTRAKGSSTPHVDPDLLWNYDFPIPPLNEQKRIVAKIEELFSELDNGINALKTAQEQLKVYRQAVLKHAFEGKLTEKWRKDNKEKTWTSENLGDLLIFLTSGSRGWAQFYSDSGDIFIRAQNLKHDRLDLDDKAYVSLPQQAEGKRTKVQLDDLLITITGANVTKTGIVNTDIGTAYVSQHVALCRPSNKINSEFLYWFLIAESAGRRQLTKFAYGAGKPGLNLNNIRSIKVNLPPLQEQLEIVMYIKKILSIEEDTLRTVNTELLRIQPLRQSILKKAFSGHLVPQDPNDEPASELLARIQAEKAIVKSPVSNRKSKAKGAKV